MGRNKMTRIINSVVSNIMEGDSTKDKMYISISFILYFIFRFVPRHFHIVKENSYAYYGEFILKDITVKNEDGTFYCRKRTVDAPIVSINNELIIRDFFKFHDKKVFLDVGAHIGKYTIIMSKKLGNSGKVISFEPDPDNYNVLKKNILLNHCENIIALNIGLWSKKDKLKLYDGFGNENTHGRSVVRTTCNFVEIDVDTLDNILEKLGIKEIDLIKIDVEDAEVEVFKGANETIKLKPKLIFECWGGDNLEQIKNILKPFDYKIEKTSEPGYYFAQ